ncbi:MAG: hypothetical protein WC956_07525, partial [bacterium]
GIEAAQIPSLHGVLSGKASIVAKAQSEGADGFTLAKGLTLSGSIVVPEGKLTGFDGAGGAFSDDAWKALEELGKSVPDEATEKKLAAASGDVLDFKASFEIKEDSMGAGEVVWHQPLYSARLAVAAAASGKLSGEGMLKLPKDIAAQLIRDAAAQKLLLEKSGELALPVSASGAMTAPRLAVDRTKLSAFVEEKAKVVEVAAPPPAKEAAAKGKAAAPAAPKETKPAEKPAAKPAVPEQKAPAPEQKAAAPAPKKEGAAAQAAPAAPAKQGAAPAESKPKTEGAKKKSSPRLQDQEEEDILKVIIGK